MLTTIFTKYALQAGQALQPSQNDDPEIASGKKTVMSLNDFADMRDLVIMLKFANLYGHKGFNHLFNRVFEASKGKTLSEDALTAPAIQAFEAEMAKAGIAGHPAYTRIMGALAAYQETGRKEDVLPVWEDLNWANALCEGDACSM